MGMVENNLLSLYTYPNPVSGSSFSVQLSPKEWDLPDYKRYRLKLYDLLGTLHYDQSGEFIKNESIEVNVGYWPSGSYLLEMVFDDRFRSTIKLIKN
jgi:hypothetical protein